MRGRGRGWSQSVGRAGRTTVRGTPRTRRSALIAILVVPGLLVGLLAGPFVPAVASPTITEYPLPAAADFPNGITAGPDGALWFTDSSGTIGRITTSGSVTDFQANAAYAITAGPDGALWFTEPGFSQIGRITTSGAVTEFPVGGVQPYGITAGSDGALWFAEAGNSGQIGRITTSGSVTEFPFGNGFTSSITAGPDGALWFTIYNGSAIGRMTTSGSFSEFFVPTQPAATGGTGDAPNGITTGPDGALWFTEENGTANKIGRVTTSGSVTEFAIPTPSSQPNSITAAPDGALWFTEANGNKIGRVTTSGSVTEFPIPTSISAPRGITTGPDAAVWFAEFSGNQIGRVTVGPGPPASLVLAPKTATGTVGTQHCVTATVDDASANPTPNVNVVFSVTGSVNTGGTQATDVSGNAQFCYQGPNLPGADAITAFADTNRNGVQDPGEPSDEATMAWLLPTATTGQATGGGQIPGGVAFGFTAKSDSTSVKGECSVVDVSPVNNIKIKCTDVTILVQTGNKATFFGDAIVNGTATTYRIDVQDNAEPGAGADTFSIQTVSGYTASGALVNGNIQVH